MSTDFELLDPKSIRLFPFVLCVGFIHKSEVDHAHNPSAELKFHFFSNLDLWHWNSNRFFLSLWASNIPYLEL